MTDIVILLVVLAIVGAASRYVYKEKKKGTKCIGCPAGCSCSGGCSGKCPSSNT